MSENHASPRPTPQPFCFVYARFLPMHRMGLLSVEERSDVEAHLEDCAWCQYQLATYDVLDAALRRQFAGETLAFPVAAPRTRPTLSLEEIMQASNQPPAITPPPAPSLERPRNSRLSMIGTVAAALVLTVLVASLFAYFGSQASAPATQPTPTPNPTPPIPTPNPTPLVLPPFDLGAHLLATAVLDAAALLIAALLCVALGVFMRVRPRAATVVIATIRPLSLAVPAFVLGPLLSFIFVMQLHLFPVGATNGQLFDVRRLFLPALTLAISALALTLAQVRSRLFAVARADGSRAASWAVIGLHLLGATISWTFVVEILFGWPGLGAGAFMYGIFLYDVPSIDVGTVRGTLWSIVLVTSALYLDVALAIGVAARWLGQRGAVTDSEPVAPEPPDAGQGAGRGLPRWATLTLLGIGTALAVAVVLATIFAPLFTRYNPAFIDISTVNSPPSGAHPLGTDDLGRDVLSQLLYMGRVSLSIGAFSVVLAGAGGLALAALLRLIPSARRRTVVMVDGALTTLMAFPALFLALGLVELLHPGFASLFVVFAILQVPTFARLGLNLLRRRRDTADGSPVSQRLSTPTIIGRLFAQACISMAIVLVEVSALTFYLGSFATDMQLPPFSGAALYPPPLFDWGALIGAHGSPFTPAWYAPSLDAAVALGISVLGFTLAGQALRSLLNRRAAPN